MHPKAHRRGLAAWIACLGRAACAGLAATPTSAETRAGPFLYTDAQGSTHMVQTFDEVPLQHRASLRSLGASPDASRGVEYQSRVSTMTPRRAYARAPRRWPPPSPSGAAIP